MNIPKALIKYYFDYFVSDFADDMESMPESRNELDEYLKNLKLLLMENHEQIDFTLGLKKIVEYRCSDLQEYYGYSFPLEEEEIVWIMKYLIEALAPRALPEIDVNLSNDSIEFYRVKNGLLHKVELGQNLEIIAKIHNKTEKFIIEANPYWSKVCGLADPIEAGCLVKLKLADAWH